MHKQIQTFLIIIVLLSLFQTPLDQGPQQIPQPDILLFATLSRLRQLCPSHRPRRRSAALRRFRKLRRRPRLRWLVRRRRGPCSPPLPGVHVNPGPPQHPAGPNHNPAAQFLTQGVIVLRVRGGRGLLYFSPFSILPPPLCDRRAYSKNTPNNSRS